MNRTMITVVLTAAVATVASTALMSCSTPPPPPPAQAYYPVQRTYVYSQQSAITPAPAVPAASVSTNPGNSLPSTIDPPPPEIGAGSFTLAPDGATLPTVNSQETPPASQPSEQPVEQPQASAPENPSPPQPAYPPAAPPLTYAPTYAPVPAYQDPRLVELQPQVVPIPQPVYVETPVYVEQPIYYPQPVYIPQYAPPLCVDDTTFTFGFAFGWGNYGTRGYQAPPRVHAPPPRHPTLKYPPITTENRRNPIPQPVTVPGRPNNGGGRGNVILPTPQQIKVAGPTIQPTPAPLPTQLRRYETDQVYTPPSARNFTPRTPDAAPPRRDTPGYQRPQEVSRPAFVPSKEVKLSSPVTVPVKPADVKPVQIKPVDVKPTQIRPAEIRPLMTLPKNQEIRPTEIRPMPQAPKANDIRPVEIRPVPKPPAQIKQADPVRIAPVPAPVFKPASAPATVLPTKPLVIETPKAPVTDVPRAPLAVPAPIAPAKAPALSAPAQQVVRPAIIKPMETSRTDKVRVEAKRDTPVRIEPSRPRPTPAPAAKSDSGKSEGKKK